MSRRNIARSIRNAILFGPVYASDARAIVSKIERPKDDGGARLNAHRALHAPDSAADIMAIVQRSYDERKAARRNWSGA